MATKNIDSRRDIWGALISESTDDKVAILSNEKQFLFIGSEKCGKSSIQNAFFNRSDEPNPTLALSYQSATLQSQELTKILHFWELGGGSKLEPILDTIVTEENQLNFVIFICFDISKNLSILEATEWLPKIMRRFKKGYSSAFLIGTHYEDFENKDPSSKGKIISGLRSLAYQYGTGLILFSNKNDFLISRFKKLIKSLVLPDVKRPDPVTTHTGPTLIYQDNDDEAPGTEVAGQFLASLKIESDKEKSDNPKTVDLRVDDEVFAEEEIDKLVQTNEKELDEKIKLLQASIND
ncbi:cytoplasmic dynein 2 light intermediate chain 1 [Histomonas meleagridis]|uniref:cytoplasmic dynein 2 light intermediate chain 1 n=1 Tax=Histomonas meleagridis TaxID=135588 RepID=UPI003559E85A|nr:cytoplasmic dynein 2 light intermediate chain 1 [Histomonas meleagridis]KAH0803166.1 cytoplasmic dynein 2 light intermediate chain 1 [Histomonas meleagridis]